MLVGVLAAHKRFVAISRVVWIVEVQEQQFFAVGTAISIIVIEQSDKTLVGAYPLCITAEVAEVVSSPETHRNRSNSVGRRGKELPLIRVLQAFQDLSGRRFGLLSYCNRILLYRLS